MAPTQLLAQVELVEADLARHRGAVAGQLSVATFATAARSLLPNALRTLRQKYPRLTVRLLEQEPGEAISALCHGDVDIAVVQDWSDRQLNPPQSLSELRLLEDTLDLAVPADHRLAGQDQVALTDLGDEDWITWTAGQLCHDWLADVFATFGTQPRITHTASEHSTQLALVAAGLGVAIIPRLGRDPAPDGVRFLAVQPMPRRQITALWRTSAEHHPAVQAVLATLRDAAA